MLYEKGECFPKGEKYNYKLYFNIPVWIVQVFKGRKILGEEKFNMSYEPRCGIDSWDSNMIDIIIAKIIKKDQDGKKRSV
jgi:hypothetical protein